AQLPTDPPEALPANARNKVYFTCSPRDARELSQHTLPELDEHDLSHLDAYTTATRLLVGGRQLPAFTMRTRPQRPIVGETTAIRQVAAAAVPEQETSAVDAVVRTATSKEKERKRRRRPTTAPSASAPSASAPSASAPSPSAPSPSAPLPSSAAPAAEGQQRPVTGSRPGRGDPSRQGSRRRPSTPTG